MTKTKNMFAQLASVCTVLLGAILFISANTASCAIIHQPKAPKELSRFSKIN